MREEARAAPQKGYPGVNPHLNSALQQPGGAWRSFHTYFLTYTAQILNRVLPPGYYAQPEQSLQISVYDLDDPWDAPHILTSYADVLVRGAGQTNEPSPASTVATPTQVFPILNLIDDEDTLSGVLIYRDERPVTRIEVLSPSNKPGGSHYRDYLTGRVRVLAAGLRLIEIDLLHERPPITPQVANYAARQPGAFPYSILVTDPRPSLAEGRTAFYGWGVLDVLPTIPVPLEDRDESALPLGEVYAMVYVERPFWSRTDMGQLPAHFDSYMPEDQARIREQMARLTAR